MVDLRAATATLPTAPSADDVVIGEADVSIFAAERRDYVAPRRDTERREDAGEKDPS